MRENIWAACIVEYYNFIFQHDSAESYWNKMNVAHSYSYPINSHPVQVHLSSNDLLVEVFARSDHLQTWLHKHVSNDSYLKTRDIYMYLYYLGHF